jgi:hypothetical protein
MLKPQTRNLVVANTVPGPAHPRLDGVSQLQPPFHALQPAPQVGDLIGAGGVDRVEGGEVMIKRGEPGLNPGEAQAHLSLDIIQFGVDAAEHIRGQVFDVVSHGCRPGVACLDATLSLFCDSGKG